MSLNFGDCFANSFERPVDSNPANEASALFHLNVRREIKHLASRSQNATEKILYAQRPTSRIKPGGASHPRLRRGGKVRPAHRVHQLLGRNCEESVRVVFSIFFLIA